MKAYTELETVFRRLYNLQHLQSLGLWDMEVSMPPKGSEARGEALALLSELVHATLAAPEVAAGLDACEAKLSELSETQRANVREMRRQWRRETLLPAEFVARRTRLVSRARRTWQEAQQANRVALFLPVLRELVACAREEGGYLAAGTGLTPYDALVQFFDPGLTTARLDTIFDDVKSWLPQLLRDVRAKQAAMLPAVPLEPPFSVEKQESLARFLMSVFEFDFSAGRLDVSPHPMTGMTKEDCRISTRYETDSALRSLFFVIHESGHALYQMRCGPREHRTQPVCRPRSHTIDESQSLLVEKFIARSDPFIEFITPKLAEHLGPQKAFTIANMKRLVTQVEPGLIRIHADEVSYPLHIILRYEVERDLMNGAMEVEEVPRVWNAKMKEYLGVDVGGRDDLGCLQDIHWCVGKFGYFPTYSIGALFAAQLMETIRKEIGGETVDSAIRRGELKPIFDSLERKIWSQGRLYESDELVLRATGEPLNPRFFRDHLVRRYLANPAASKL